MDLALFVLRAVIGAFFIGHGAQKLFGAFGGHGKAGTSQFFESLGLRPGRLHASAAGWAELGGGALLLLGLFTPLGAAAIIGVMTVAIVTVHAKNGPWVTNSGYEYNAVLIAACFALAGAGAGAWSLDAAIGWDVAGAGWALGALAVGMIGGLAAVAFGRRSAAPAAPSTPGDPAADRAGRIQRERTPAGRR